MESILEERFTHHVSTKMDTYRLSILIFLVGPYLEVGEFYSVRSRRGSVLSRAAQHRQQQQQQQESESIVVSTIRSSTTKIVAPMTTDAAIHLTSDVKPCFGEIIDIAFEHIAAECARQREM